MRTHRRLRLPADDRSPATARAAVREVLVELGLQDLMDEALLLTTELSTNGVIHAGTDLDVEVIADAGGVTVTVTDFKGGPIEAGAAVIPDRLSEHGRGLLLVDEFASSWGTMHDSNGKGVWFRLDHGVPGGAPAPRRPVSVDGPANGRLLDGAGDAGVTPQACEWLIHVPDEMRARLSLDQLVSELLLRLCEVTGADGGSVWLDSADGQGVQPLAVQGHPPPPAVAREAREGLAVPLPLPRPLSGSLALYEAPGRVAAASWEPLARLSAERMAVAIEADRLREADTRRRGWLTFLAEASELLAQSLDVDLTLALVPQIVVPRLGEWCAVHVSDEWGDLRLATCAHADETALPVLKRLLGIGVGDVHQRLLETLQTGRVVMLSHPLEGLAVPLAARGNLLGTLSVGRPGRLHGPDDVAVIEDVARRASLAIDNARIHADRKQVAQAFQRALLPSLLPAVTGVGFGAEYVPASTGTDVGGDFYDVLELPEDRWLVSIGDVCGKGPQAAALTGLVRDVVRVLVRDGRPLPRALELLNRTLMEQHEDGRYCTLAVGLAVRRGDALDLQLCLAGHDRPLLLDRGGSTTPVGVCGTAVGLLPQVQVTAQTCTLGPGEALVFFTDGVTERRRGPELFGHARLARELGGLGGQPAPAVAARLRTTVLDFSSDPPRDDIAILVIRNDG